jgi:catechol 2,3-dioxygenase-like lactoylglutathione lyase family enzyme
MSVQLNHTIVSCRDQQRSAAFLAGILGLRPATRFGHFLVVQADNDVSLDFAETSGPITPQHYAFLVSETEFDATFDRLREPDPEPGHQPPRRGPRPVLRGPRRAPAGDPDPPLRQRSSASSLER